MSTHQNKISLLTINYNSTKYLKKLIKSSEKLQKYINEIIVIDNNSNLNNYNRLKRIKKSTLINTKLIRNKTNLGFSKAVNQGIGITKNNLILLINPDCLITNTDSINEMINCINKSKNNIAVGGKIYKNNKGKIQYSATRGINFMTGIFEFTNVKKIWKNNPWSKNFWIETNKITKPISVSSLCGAFFLFKKKVKNIKFLFDENFFLYLEDLDFGLQITKLGYKVVFCPNSWIIHHGGKSNTSKYNIELKYWYKSREYLFKKYLPKYQYVILKLIFSIEEKLLSLYHFLKNEPAY